MNTILLVAVILLESLILISLWVALYHVFKQRGRMLMRLDMLEDRLAFVNRIAARPQQSRTSGLAPGTPLPAFRLPDLSGELRGPEDYPGKGILLIHWSPRCGFCTSIAPTLAALQADLDKQNIQMLLVSSGDAGVNREVAEKFGLECPILLQSEAQRVEAFTTFGTPVAYLLNAEHAIVKPIAIGADCVPNLAREAAAVAIAVEEEPKNGHRRKGLPGERPLSESRIEREGIKAGTPAPLFELPDLHGGKVTLEAYRGRKVLLVFSDPNCGPCQQLAPSLNHLYRHLHDDAPSILMISRGEVEENRRKVAEQGLEFPVILQRKWEISKQYGIFATPVGFLIGEDGVLCSDVAKGVEAILALLRREGAVIRR